MNIVEQLFNDRSLAQFSALPALRWDNGVWSYAQLCSHIGFIAQNLRGSGLGEDDRVVFLCSDTPVFVATYFAAMKLGAVAIAVSTRCDADDLAHVLRDSEAKAVVFDGGFAFRCRQAQSRAGTRLRMKQLDELVAGMDQSETTALGLDVCSRSPGDEALWVYSSGTTSRPKAIVHTHKDIGRCEWFHKDVMNVQQGDLVFCTSKISFAYALANGLIAPLRLGACVFLHPDWVTPASVSAVIRYHNPDFVFSVPTIYRYLLGGKDDGLLEKADSVRLYASAGEHLPGAVQRGWLDATGVPVINTFGCSETLFLCFAGNGRDTPPGSVGRPMPQIQVRLSKGDEMLDCDSGEPGLMHVRYPFIFSRYANRSDESAARLQDGWFNTGDLFLRDAQGNWFHQGREDELIKVSGRWVSLRAIEEACVRSGMSVESAVVSAPDVDGTVRAALFFVPSGSVEHSKACKQMQLYLNIHLERLMQPSWIRAIPRMPRTQNGKVRRHSLIEQIEGMQRDEIDVE